MAVTSRDIARIVGVSVSTVSRSLNDNPRISVGTREKIKRVAAELDFEFDASARSLSTRRSGTVALVCPDSIERFDNGLYVNLLIHDLRRSLAARGLDCLVTEAAPPSGPSTIRRLVLQRKVDGILLLLAGTMPEDWTLIRKRGIPVVQVHYAPSYFDADRLDYFFTDNLTGGRLAARALFESGSRRIAYLAAPSPNLEMADRERGLRAGLAEFGLVPDERLRLEVENSYEKTYEFVRANIATLKRADGLFAITDLMALASMRALAEEGVEVPRDLRLVGYDDIDMASHSFPPLTTIRQPLTEAGAAMVDSLVHLLDGQTPDSLRLRTTLIVRASTARV